MPDAVEDSLIQKGETRALLDYLWDRAEYKKYLQGPDPGWRAWAKFFMAETINSALLKCLERQGVHDAVRDGTVTPFLVSDELLSEAAEVLVPRIVDRTFRYRGTCPMRFFKGVRGKIWSLAPDVRLRLLHPDETAEFLISHERELTFWDTPMALGDAAILEISGSVARSELHGSHDGIQGVDRLAQRLCDRIDRVKWALTSGLTSFARVAPIESIVILEDALGGGLSVTPPKVVRREDKSAGTIFEVTDENVRTLTLLVSAADRYAAKSDDVAEAFRHWGRSAFAHLPRDQLLEAVIGLERLLVPDQGELAYRLATNGTTLLAEPGAGDAEREALWRELKQLYRLRSKAAHGRGGKSGDRATAPRAMALLGRALERVIQLLDGGQLTTEEGIGKQLEQLVIRQLPRL